MSKSSQSRLTGSRKKRVGRSRLRPRPPGKSALDVLNALDERCERIETLAALLYACTDPGSMDARLAARAGYFIEEEMRRVKELLAGIGKGTLANLKEGR